MSDLRSPIKSELRIRQLEEERAFLLERSKRAGDWYADAKRSVGTSSNAMVRYAFGGSSPDLDEYPRDPSDLAACYRARHQLPAHLQPAADEILPHYRKVVEARYPLIELDASLKEEGIRV